MKKSDILTLVKEIKSLVENRNYTECNDDEEWISHYECLFDRIEQITKEILGEDK